MAEETEFEVQCRCGEYAPLKVNRNGRFYYSHRRGCQHEERFDSSIDDPDDLPITLRSVTKKKRIQEDESAPSKPDYPEKVVNDVLQEEDNGHFLDWFK